MKNLLRLSLILFLFTTVSYSQNYGSLSVSYNAPVDVGVPTWFTFKFTPIPLPSGATHYVIENWSIDVQNIDGNPVHGYIDTPGSLFYVDNDFTNSLDDEIQLPIQAGGNNTGYEDEEKTIYISAIVYYKDNSNNIIQGGYVTKQLDVQINRIQPPSISGETVLLDCNDDEFKLTADAGAANDFDWSIIPGSGGANIIAGNGSNTVTIKPDLTGEFDVKVVARRTQADSRYHKEKTIHISRKARSIFYYVPRLTIPNTNIVYVPDFICTDSELEVAIPDDNNYSNIVWNAPNCTAHYLRTSGGWQYYGIQADPSIVGTQIDVSVTAYYNGGCDATSTSRSFKIYDGETPPMPDGHIIPAARNGGAFVEMRYTESYDNGATFISPSLVQLEAQSTTINVEVAYYNYCNDETTSRVYTVYIPGYNDIDDGNGPPHVKSAEKFTIAPNPSDGNFKINFSKAYTGEYYVYDLYGKTIAHNTFYNAKSIKLNIKSDTKQNIIFVYTKEWTSSQQLIIK